MMTAEAVYAFPRGKAPTLVLLAHLLWPAHSLGVGGTLFQLAQQGLPTLSEIAQAVASCFGCVQRKLNIRDAFYQYKQR